MKLRPLEAAGLPFMQSTPLSAEPSGTALVPTYASFVSRSSRSVDASADVDAPGSI